MNHNITFESLKAYGADDTQIAVINAMLSLRKYTNTLVCGAAIKAVAQAAGFGTDLPAFKKASAIIRKLTAKGLIRNFKENGYDRYDLTPMDEALAGKPITPTQELHPLESAADLVQRLNQLAAEADYTQHPYAKGVKF